MNIHQALRTTIFTRRALAAFVVFVVAFSAAFLLPGARRPRLEVEESRVEFGEVPAGQRATRIIDLFNRGSSPLEILDVVTSCGCSDAHLAETVIQPGESGQLSVTVTGGGGALPRSFSIKLRTNDPQQPVRVIRGGFRTVGESFIQPSPLDLGRLNRQDLPVSGHIDYYPAYRADDRRLTPSATTDASFLRITRSSMPMENTDPFSFLVELTTDAPAGRIEALIQISDDDSARGIEHHVRVFATVAGEYTAQPPVLVYGPISAGQPLSRRVVEVRHAELTAGQLPVTSVRAIGPIGELLHAKIVSSGGQPIVEVLPSRTPERNEGLKRELRGALEITVVTPADAAEVLNVPVSIYVGH